MASPSPPLAAVYGEKYDNMGASCLELGGRRAEGMSSQNLGQCSATQRTPLRKPNKKNIASAFFTQHLILNEPFIKSIITGPSFFYFWFACMKPKCARATSLFGPLAGRRWSDGRTYTREGGGRRGSWWTSLVNVSASPPLRHIRGGGQDCCTSVVGGSVVPHYPKPCRGGRRLPRGPFDPSFTLFPPLTHLRCRRKRERLTFLLSPPTPTFAKKKFESEKNSHCCRHSLDACIGFGGQGEISL